MKTTTLDAHTINIFHRCQIEKADKLGITEKDRRAIVKKGKELKILH